MDNSGSKHLSKVRLTDSIEVSELQIFQNAFSAAFKLPAVIISPDGKTITNPSNFNPFYEKLLTKESGIFSCLTAEPQIEGESLKTHTPVKIKCNLLSFLCLNLGPITIQDEIKGYFCLLEISGIIDESIIRAFANKNELNEEALIDDAAALTETKNELLASAKILLKEICRQVSNIAGQNITNSMLLAEQELYKKELEESRLEQNKQFESIFRNAADPMFIADKKTGIILDANNAATKLIKKPFEQIKGTHQSILHPKNHRQDGIDTFQKHLSELDKNDFSAPVENLLVDSEGGNIPVEILSNTLNYKGVECIMGTFRDISERKKVEVELKIAKDIAEENMIRFQSMFELHSAPMLLIEPESGKIIDGNKAAIQYYGYEKEKFKSLRISDINQMDNAQIAENLKKATTQKDNHFFFQHELANGKVKYVEVYSTPIPFKGNTILFSIIHDITERKIAEQKNLQEKKKAEKYQKQLRAIENNLHNGMVFQEECNESLSPRFIYLSNIVSKFYGCSPDQAIQDPEKIYGRIIEEDRQKLFEAKKQSIQERKPIDIEIQVINPDDSIRWSRYLSSPRFDGNSCIWDGIEINITDYKIIEKQLISAKEKAEESDKMKTVFLENVSHEIRTPLNAICGFANQLTKPSLDDHKRTRFNNILQSSSRQLLSIINDILTISSLVTKETKLEKTACHANVIIQTIEDLYKNEAQRRGIQLNVQIPDNNENERFFGDRIKIIQVLSNLLSNSLKYTEKGFIEIGYSIHNNQIAFYVKDTGIGMTEEEQEIIFKRFTQANDNIRIRYGGIGLGLAISNGYAELMDGDLRVESIENEGTTMYFTIPFDHGEGKSNRRSTKPLSKMPDKNIKILIAEDEEFNYLFLEELLSDKNCQLLHSSTGKETVELFESNSDIDLILMDIKMPDMDGYSAATIIRSKNSSIPIIAQTAYATEKEVEKYKDAFDTYLAKPIEEEQLIYSINKLLLPSKKQLH